MLIINFLALSFFRHFYFRNFFGFLKDKIYFIGLNSKENCLLQLIFLLHKKILNSIDSFTICSVFYIWLIKNL
jgi:hypothetical protein